MFKRAKISKIASIKKQDIDIEEEEMRKLVPMTEENLDYIVFQVNFFLVIYIF